MRNGQKNPSKYKDLTEAAGALPTAVLLPPRWIRPPGNPREFSMQYDRFFSIRLAIWTEWVDDSRHNKFSPVQLRDTIANF
jgi:hypothetical protein